MRKLYLSLIFITLVSCSLEHDIKSSVADKVPASISASSGELTKTAGLSSIVWLPGDKITVFDSSMGNNCFQWDGTSESATASFSGEIATGSSMTYALYPYDGTASMASDGNMTVTIPSDVVFTRTESIAPEGNVSAGVIGADGAVTMKNVCGVIGFKVTDSNVLWVKISSNDGSALTGKVKLSLADGTPKVTQVVGGCNWVKGEVPGPGTYYFSVLPGEHNGVSVEVHYANWVQNYTASTSKTLTVARSAIVTHPDIPASTAVYTPDALVAEMKACTTMDEDFQVENSFVHGYMTNVTYKDGDYSYTSVRDYYLRESDKRQCYPSDKTVSWTVSGVSTSQKMIIVDAATGKVTANDLDNALRKTKISNFIPGHTYYYAIARINHLDGSYIIFKNGAFKAIGQTRMLRVTTVDGNYVKNVRDIGGWPALGGKKTAYGKMFRGYALNDEDNKNEVVPDWNGIKTMRDLGITAEMELRPNLIYTASVLGPDIKYDNPGTTSCMDKGLINTPGKYKEMLAIVADNLKNGRSTYVHCAGGADRTGTFYYLLLALCGVSESDLSKEYELTAFNSSTRYRCNKDGYNNTEDPEHLLEPESELRFRNMIEYLDTFSGTTMNEKVETYVKGTLGITQEQIDNIRNGLLE